MVLRGLNTKLKDLKIGYNILVAAIWRGRNIIFPTGEDEIKEKDTIVIAATEDKNIEDINDILE